MRRVVSTDHGLADRLDVAVDPSATPADWDQALAVFLVRYVRSRATRSAGTATAEQAGDKHQDKENEP